MTFKRTRQQPGVWPFKCKVLARCNKLRQQSCGCEGEGTAEKAALVYHFAETGQPGNTLVWIFVFVIFLCGLRKCPFHFSFFNTN